MGITRSRRVESWQDWISSVEKLRGFAPDIEPSSRFSYSRFHRLYSLGHSPRKAYRLLSRGKGIEEQNLQFELSKGK